MERLKLPKIGLGTWMLKSQTCRESVLNGLDIGYRFVDTAQMYGNESEVGDALELSTIPRKDVILATKLGILNLLPRKVLSSVKESLRKLKTDYVDILYIHWPVKFTYNPKKTLGAMNELVKEGVVRFIGVSNFTIELLKKAMEISETPILANQVEFHPMLRQQKLHAFNTSKNIYTVAYSPLGRGNIWKNEVLRDLSEKHQIPVQQVCLAYLIQRHAIPIPKASSKEHLKTNFESVNVKLNENDISRIEQIPENRIINPIIAPKWDID